MFQRLQAARYLGEERLYSMAEAIEPEILAQEKRIIVLRDRASARVGGNDEVGSSSSTVRRFGTSSQASRSPLPSMAEVCHYEVAIGKVILMPDTMVEGPNTVERARSVEDVRPRPRWGRAIAVIAILAALVALAGQRALHGDETSAPPPPPPPKVTVSTPLQESVANTTSFLGQFSAVDAVELRAQVGGTLVAIAFQDGQIVQKGDPLFTIDPRPYQIKLDRAVAQFQSAQARTALAEAELWRARQLKQTEFGTVENVDQRAAEQRSAVAAIDTAKAAIKDSQLDLEFSQIVAPFTGRMGAHLVSAGSLVSGSRGGTSNTTLLATIVSLDPVHLDFDMSEADYRAHQRARQGTTQPADVAISLNGDARFDRHGKLDFIDNTLNRSSGTIHARATVANPDLAITPGQFARLRVATNDPVPALLVPAAAIVPDQSRQMVMTVTSDGTVVPKQVETGELHGGLRVIRSGLARTDVVIIGGLVRARPGAKVTPITGTIASVPDHGDG
jgi:membrane fusion protein, multidrug efflux system